MIEASLRADHAPSSPNRSRIALAHDWLVGMRGGEQVLDRLALLYGPTKLYTLVCDGRPLTPAIDRCTIITSPLQRLPGAAWSWRRHYLPLMPWVVGALRVTDCDLLISTSSAVMKSIRPPRGVPHLCYCHTPPRYIWEQTADYAHGSRGLLRSAALRMVRQPFQAWDRRTASRVTQFLANSHHTAQRIQRCYGREAKVVYPPVRTEFFTIDPSVPREDWLLVVGALEPYKRTDLVVEMARSTGMRVKIAGTGSQVEALRAAAGPSVEFLGRVNDQALRDLYRRARALIFPQVEDFGIIAVEAQACGCPVLAFTAGGALETVTPGSGVFFDEQSPAALADAVAQLDRTPHDVEACRHSALRFSEAAFDTAIHLHVEELLGNPSCQDS